MADARRRAILPRPAWLSGLFHAINRPLARLAGVDLCSALGARTAVGVAVALRGFPFREADRRARANWRRLRPDQAGEAETDAAVRRMWRKLGRTLAEYYVLDRLNVPRRVTIEGAHHMDAVRAAGDPLLIAPLHLGNWELLGPLQTSLGQPGAGPYHPPVNPFDHRLLVWSRAKAGFYGFPAWPDGIRGLLRQITTGERVAWLFVDDFTHGRVGAPRLGRPGRLEGNIRLACKLAVATGAGIVPAYVARGEGARFHVVFREPFRMTATRAQGPEFEADLERLNAIYEPIVLAHLDQWFWLPNFGAPSEEASAPPPLSGRLLDGPGTDRAGPHPSRRD